MTVYYNEIDPFAAETLRNLIKAGLIAPGIVDERSIEDVNPQELREFKQCHFFAGVGVWSYALRRAGWPDDRAVWTGSCPCQPFSTAGEGAGFADERHLWPHFFHLIRERRPAVVYGEQVASRDADPWIDLVCDDLEAVGYAVAAVPFPSAGVGAPHIRDRLYWVAHADSQGRAEQWRQRIESERLASDSVASGLGDATNFHGGSSAQIRRLDCPKQSEQSQACGEGDGPAFGTAGAVLRPGPTNGLWSAADWLQCRDGSWRPVEPGTFPLAHGAPSRVGRLRAYGNAINAEAARVFIESFGL